MLNGYFNCLSLRWLLNASRGQFFGHWEISEFFLEGVEVNFPKSLCHLNCSHLSFTNTKTMNFTVKSVDGPGCWRECWREWGHDDIIQGWGWMLLVVKVVQEVNAGPQIILNWFFVKAYFLSYSLFYWK